ncbi:MAG TPA: MATE family efflux transporter, partial [Tepidisphaeraceae bacterium]
PLKRTLREDLEALDYAPEPPLDFQAIYANGVIIALGSAIMGIAAIALYAALFHRFHKLAAGTSLAQVRQFVFFIGVGTILRLASDPMGAVLQIRSRIALDNLLVTIADVLWMALCAAALLWAGAASFGTPIAPHVHAGLLVVGATFALSGAVLLLLRTVFAAQRTGIVWPRWDLIRKAVLMSLLMYGLFVAAAQLADFLYSPTDYILINRLIDPVVVAVYAPAVQIDAGLYLLVTGLAAVLLPKTALAHAAGHLHTVRRYYVRGTLFSVAVLIPAAVAVYLASPWIFRLWLGNEMKPTQAILWMVLLHTIIGGSSGIGRSILLAIGKVKPFTLSVLIGGTANVLMSYAFVKFGHMGLKGIVLGTILAVAGRCLLWLPWYVMRVLRRMEAEQTPAASAV